jgi:hypothetical protein
MPQRIAPCPPHQARYAGVALLQSAPMLGITCLLLTAHSSGTAAGYRYARVGPPPGAQPTALAAASGAHPLASQPPPQVPRLSAHATAVGRNLLALMAPDHISRALHTTGLLALRAGQQQEHSQAVALQQPLVLPWAPATAAWQRAPAARHGGPLLLRQAATTAQQVPAEGASQPQPQPQPEQQPPPEELASLLVTAAQALASANSGGTSRGAAAAGLAATTAGGAGAVFALPRGQLDPPKKQRVPLLGHDSVQELAQGTAAQQQAAAAPGEGETAGESEAGAAVSDTMEWLPPPTSWRGVTAAVATRVPQPLLAGTLVAALLNLAAMGGLFFAAAHAARVPPLRHLLVHVVRMRGGLRVLAPVAEEALSVMVERDWDEDSDGNDGCSQNPAGAQRVCAASSGSSDGSAAGGGASADSDVSALDISVCGVAEGCGVIDEGKNGGGRCVWAARGGRRLLVSSAWHWGSSPDGSGPWLPLVPRYLLPSDGGWLGPGQMARLAELAFQFYGCTCGSPGAGSAGPGASSRGAALTAPPQGGCTACWRALCLQRGSGAATGDANAKRQARAEQEQQAAQAEGHGSPPPQQQPSHHAGRGAGVSIAAAASLNSSYGTFNSARGQSSGSSGEGGSGERHAPVTALELEHLEGTELCVIAARGLEALPHVRRLTLRWCQISGRCGIRLAAEARPCGRVIGTTCELVLAIACSAKDLSRPGPSLCSSLFPLPPFSSSFTCQSTAPAPSRAVAPSLADHRHA